MNWFSYSIQSHIRARPSADNQLEVRPRSPTGDRSCSHIRARPSADNDNELVDEKESSLHCAAASGYGDECRVLLEHGADLEAKNRHGRTPLILAAGNGYIDVCRILLQGGANTEAFDNNRMTSLHWAARGHAEVCFALLEHGANIEAVTRLPSCHTPLCVAALFNAGKPCCDEEGLNPLQFDRSRSRSQCAQQELATCRVLVAHGANVLVDYEWRKEQCLIVDQYNSPTTHPPSYEGKTFHKNLWDRILLECRTDLCRIFIDFGRVSINEVDSEVGWEPIHWAARNSNSGDNMVRMLIERGANVNAVDSMNKYSEGGNTPLHLAIGHFEKDSRGIFGAFDNVSYGGEGGIVKMAKCRALLAAGANVNVSNQQHATPLHLAAIDCNAKLCTLLIENGAEVNARDNSNRTPLHEAVRQEIYYDFGTRSGSVLPRFLQPEYRIRNRIRSIESEHQQSFSESRPARWTNGSTTMVLVYHGADTTATATPEIGDHGVGRTPEIVARRRGLLELARHLKGYDEWNQAATPRTCTSASVRRVRCTGPDLQPTLMWVTTENDLQQMQMGFTMQSTPPCANGFNVSASSAIAEEKLLLDRMQSEWLVTVSKSSAHARVGVVLRQAASGRLSPSILAHIMGFVASGPTQEHWLSYISQDRVPHTLMTVFGEWNQAAMPMPPMLSLASSRIAVCVTEWSRVGHSQREKAILVINALIPVSAMHAGGGCVWLWQYLNFLRLRMQFSQFEAP
jgi:ankyrin repeat protein